MCVCALTPSLRDTRALCQLNFLTVIVSLHFLYPLPTLFKVLTSLHRPGGTLPPPCQPYIHICIVLAPSRPAPCQLYLLCWCHCTVLEGHSCPLANSIYIIFVLAASRRDTTAPLPTLFTLFLSLHCPGETLPPPCQLYLRYCCPCTIPAGHYRPLANAIFTSSHASSAYLIIWTEIPQFWRIARANNVQIIMCKLHMLPEPLPSYLHSAQPGGGGGSANTGFVFNQTYFE